MCGTRRICDNSCAWVPLPDPGGPMSTIRTMMSFYSVEVDL
jgi:hypothetical protein